MTKLLIVVKGGWGGFGVENARRQSSIRQMKGREIDTVGGPDCANGTDVRKSATSVRGRKYGVASEIEIGMTVAVGKLEYLITPSPPGMAVAKDCRMENRIPEIEGAVKARKELNG